MSDIDCNYSGNENITTFCGWLITSSYAQNMCLYIMNMKTQLKQCKENIHILDLG